MISRCLSGVRIHSRLYIQTSKPRGRLLLQLRASTRSLRHSSGTVESPQTMAAALTCLLCLSMASALGGFVSHIPITARRQKCTFKASSDLIAEHTFWIHREQNVAK
ncbi:uncharacterized protein SCHCODRAFT_02372361 [Schizophyllum commune H4-8]|uniref:uncharacterized protein n=1 Tax=Schizophyllum commune (strain H4-8 / FGSC 9210) TaxID=578458 RepID=UPI00215FC58D|nr:uncharacterized protein SCHCODRAFT_02372361 [Schizophyllum commune H4-8]KAI5889622.1 hypothetical protein SCHCODRAFT_02372361 [Schizophyllum commune H4-8]